MQEQEYLQKLEFRGFKGFSAWVRRCWCRYVSETNDGIPVNIIFPSITLKNSSLVVVAGRIGCVGIMGEELSAF